MALPGLRGWPQAAGNALGEDSLSVSQALTHPCLWNDHESTKEMYSTVVK